MVSIKALQEKVSGLFYAHGLFCASHPVPIILLVIGIGLFTCYPLVNLPLPGNPPLQYTTSLDGYKLPPPLPLFTTADQPPPDNPKQPRWYFGAPVGYIQQIVVKSVVSPWDPVRLIPSDAFRAPLAQVFDLIERVNNFQYKEGEQRMSVSEVCLRVSETLPTKKVKGLLPEYKCLTVSPANFWNHDREWFFGDNQIIKTVFQPYGKILDTPPSIRDILFGVPWKDSGVKKLYLRSRQRVISYALTLVFNKYDPVFISLLRDKLQHSYPLSLPSNNTKVQHLVHVHYKSVNYFVDYTPLMVTYVVLFLYLYFSVRKIEMVKSKWGLALSAVVTVVASLLISVAICLTFGLTPSLSGSEIFPYLVVIIGLENVLVVTKSVVSTPVHLDVKLRVAQGLSKEGWYIFKNLMTELFILVIGFFTFVPAIQEFCLFAVVGLLSDFFLQMFFYATILSIDIRRMELSDLHKQGVQQPQRNPRQDSTYPMTLPAAGPVATKFTPNQVPGCQKVNARHGGPRPPTPPPSPTSGSPWSTSDDMFFEDPTRFKTPRRVKLLNFWARTRVAQRGIMVCVLVWIVLLVYKTGIVEHLTETNFTDSFEDSNNGGYISATYDKVQENMHDWGESEHKTNHDLDMNGDSFLNSKALIYHEDPEQWRRLSHSHWPTLLGYYNISLLGRYITILPTIHLSIMISPDQAIQLRHPEEEKMADYYLKQEQEPGSSPPTDTSNHKLYLTEHLRSMPNESLTLLRVIRRLYSVPRTKLDLALTVLLGIASFILLLYFIAALYRCMCSRNYAKWRSSWAKTRKPRKSSPYYKQIREAVPLVLEGHSQSVECVATDGPLVASSCLGGYLRVWDSNSGECITAIERRSSNMESARLKREQSVFYAADGEKLQEGDPESQLSTSPMYHASSPGDTTVNSIQYMPTSKPSMSHSWSTASHSPQPVRPLSMESQDTAPVKRHSRSKSMGVSLSDIVPDLSETIDTDFMLLYRRQGDTLRPSASNHSLGNSVGNHSSASPQQGFDFSQFNPYFDQHKQFLEEKQAHVSMRKRSAMDKRGESVEELHADGDYLRDRRSWSFGDQPIVFEAEMDSALSLSDTSLAELTDITAPPVWCLAFQDNLLIAGCGNGRLEFWDGLTGQLKYVYHENKIGVTALCFVANRVIAARLNGNLDFLELETFVNINKPLTSSNSSSRLHNRGHVRQPSSSSLTGDLKSWDDIIQCSFLCSIRAHQKPINLLQTQGGRVITASQDHTLKVFRLEDSFALFTLHGHSGSVTTLFLDKSNPSCAASGSEDGAVRVWDLLTGACVHKLHGHSGSVTSLTCTQVYIISAGTDDRLCVWERCKGHLMHWIQMEPGYCNSLSMLTSNLMVTGGQANAVGGPTARGISANACQSYMANMVQGGVVNMGCLYLWDISKGEVLRDVRLGDHDNSVFIRQIQVIGNSVVVCDYGNELRVIHFPAVLEKAD